MTDPDFLRQAAQESGFQAESLEKVTMLIRLLNMLAAHPWLGPKVALKGGTALNLFVLDLPRLSVDIDLDYIGHADPTELQQARPLIEQALVQVATRLGLTMTRTPGDHAGGKWRMAYVSAFGRPANIECDINLLLRVPLWDVQVMDSGTFPGIRARAIPVLDRHEVAAGKLAALLSRGASRDLFDARELLSRQVLDRDKLRLAFVVHGGINRKDWRTVTPLLAKTTAKDVRQQLIPMLRYRSRPPDVRDVEIWTRKLVDDTQALLGVVLPLTDNEMHFLTRLNDQGAIEPEHLTRDPRLQDRIARHPGLAWKALNVRKHKHAQEPR